MTDEFSKFHPFVNILFYIFVIGITIFQMQAGLTIISFLCALIYFLYLKREKGIKFLGIVLAVIICSAVINPLFSHRGNTVLFYLFSGNAVTLESVIYGVVAAVIIGATLLWFATLNVVITSDKMLALFGTTMPHIAILITMIFRFVPKMNCFHKKVKDASVAMKGTPHTFRQKIRFQTEIYSITTTWALENSVETADSMRARGYGTGKRTCYHNYIFSVRDISVIIWLVVLFGVIIWQIAGGYVLMYYYPIIRIKGNIQIYIIYTLICMTPMLINIWEEWKWHKYKLKN